VSLVAVQPGDASGHRPFWALALCLRRIYRSVAIPMFSGDQRCRPHHPGESALRQATGLIMCWRLLALPTGGLTLSGACCLLQFGVLQMSRSLPRPEDPWRAPKVVSLVDPHCSDLPVAADGRLRAKCSASRLGLLVVPTVSLPAAAL